MGICRQEARRGGKRRRRKERGQDDSVVAIDTSRVQTEDHREAGPLHVGHQMWKQLEMDAILKRAGLSERACHLSEAMVLNRLIFPLSEHAQPDWIRRTALPDILGEDFQQLTDTDLFRNMNQLHPNRERIERELAARENNLFNLDDTVYLYDLTSTYFEGQAKRNPKPNAAMRGTSGPIASRC